MMIRSKGNIIFFFVLLLMLTTKVLSAQANDDLHLKYKILEYHPYETSVQKVAQLLVTNNTPFPLKEIVIQMKDPVDTTKIDISEIYIEQINPGETARSESFTMTLEKNLAAQGRPELKVVWLVEYRDATGSVLVKELSAGAPSAMGVSIYPVITGQDFMARVHASQLAEETGGKMMTAPTPEDAPEAIKEAIKSALKAPVAKIDGYIQGHWGEPLIFNASDSFDADGNIMFYEWDWDCDGTYDETTTLPKATHQWDGAFAGKIRLRVTDNDRLTDIIVSKVELSEPPPGDPSAAQPSITGAQLTAEEPFTNNVFDERQKVVQVSYQMVANDQSRENEETVLVRLKVRNLGFAPIKDVTASVMYAEGVSIDINTLFLGDIQGGETKTSAEIFTITSGSSTTQARPVEEKVVWAIEYVNANNQLVIEDICL